MQRQGGCSDAHMYRRTFSCSCDKHRTPVNNRIRDVSSCAGCGESTERARTFASRLRFGALTNEYSLPDSDCREERPEFL